VDHKEKARLFESLSQMKELLPAFSSAMQTYVKTRSAHAKVGERVVYETHS